MKSIKVFILVLLLSTNLHADVKMPPFFSDNMILQRDIPVNVWGWASPSENITVSFAGQTVSAIAADDGKWAVKLNPLKVNKNPQEFSVSGKNKLIFKNVLIGDVWLCSGQSNMGIPVGDCLNAEAEINDANNPMIRYFTVFRGYNIKPKTAFIAKRGWSIASPQTVKDYSGVAYFFAKEIVKTTDVPIGIICASWGGTRIEPWTPAEGFNSIPELKDIALEMSKASEAADSENSLPIKTEYEKEFQTASRIFNNMINPLIPFGIKGVLWYQGENNSDDGNIYYYKMKALISSLRSLWKQGDFPFYYVQLANYGRIPSDKAADGSGFAKLREEQLKALDIPNTGMAVTIDIGEGKNIHPKNKQDVSKRLAAWSLAKDYKKDIVPSGPLYKEFKIEADKVRIFFDYADNGLIAGKKEGLEPVKIIKDGKLDFFAVAGTDKKWYPGKALIEGKTVIVSSDKVPVPVAVRYAFSGNPEMADLYNAEGLPASPFRTDNW